ncbi:DUF1631 family protein [Chitinimonas sp. BJB300]|uniref:DUF1631 family protein n=1 Tax=Chitinimonas sp. BJB300 TaxID=1559339 RepID=UPI000C0E6814|nr:DUF1631 family protein [Chitinimonas sp. BJB300]PHV13027.1 hypothetical protein CSQ89_02870 [Chitinimonas sp. BJB300]TSJ88914.1 DUF1631 domain-containing protein [Chitinimonas sp. BJB300]
MDRNDLLTATRIEFLNAFSKAFAELVPQCVERMFYRADHSASSRDQRRLLDARAILQNRSDELIRSASNCMEQLLNRSFRTAYSTFRPHFPAGHDATGTLSLVDASAFEGELKVDDITVRYRNAADEQLRDLNIRVAILFEQDDIKERENPFRPYLFSRCMINMVEQLGIVQELGDTLVEQFRDDLTEKVIAIYARLNALLAEHGIAAQLRMAIKREPSPHSTGVFQARELAANAGFNDVVDAAVTSAAGVMPTDRHTVQASADMPLHNFIPQPPASMPSTAAARGAGRAGQILDWLRQSTAGAEEIPLTDAQLGGYVASSATNRDGPVSMGEHGLGAWLSGFEAVGTTLRQFFSPASPVRATPINSLLARSVQHLQESIPSAGDMQTADGSLRNLILEQRPDLGEKTSDVSEEMTIDIVAMLFEFILRDGQVPAEVRAQLGRLQFLVLKLALQDPTLLTQKHHPARMLVNRIGSISLGLQQSGAHGERFIAEIQRIIEQLLGTADIQPALFSQMLDEFDAFIAHELRAADEQVERAVRVLESAESNTLRFARTTAAIAEALSGLILDPYLHDFLVNGWAQAIERVDRQDAAKAKRYRELVPDLIWSIVPKVSKEERSQFLAHIPLMLGLLREGLAMTAWTAEQKQELLAWLMDSHTHALSATSVAFAVPSLADMRARFRDFIGGQETVAFIKPNQPHGLNRHMLDEAIYEIEAELNLIDRVLAVGDSPAIEEPPLFVEDEADRGKLERAETGTQQVLAQLRSGVAIEINLNGKPSRAHLNWISPTASSLVLSIDGDDKPSALSVRLFQRLLENGRAHFLEAEPLFERAVQSLLHSADRLDSLDPQTAVKLGMAA